MRNRRRGSGGEVGNSGVDGVELAEEAMLGFNLNHPSKRWMVKNIRSKRAAKKHSRPILVFFYC